MQQYPSPAMTKGAAASRLERYSCRPKLRIAVAESAETAPSSLVSLTIRPAIPSDAALVFSLVRELAEYERLLHEVEATREEIAEALFGDRPKVFADIAEWQGEPAGFALWFYNFSTFRGRHGIYLEDLFVRPQLRGHGIGKALLETLAARCEQEALARLEWSVLNWNEPSIGFYRSLGAIAKDDWTVYRLSGAALARLGARAGAKAGAKLA
jgi:GNAT superfamily N-acetyltransferase